MPRFLLPALAIALLAGPAGATPDAAAKTLYVKKCGNCHGEDGKAETKIGKKFDAEAFTSVKFQARHSDADIEKAIRLGKAKTKMKAFEGKLTDAQIKAMVDMVRSFNPEPAKAGTEAKEHAAEHAGEGEAAPAAAPAPTAPAEVPK